MDVVYVGDVDILKPALITALSSCHTGMEILLGNLATSNKQKLFLGYSLLLCIESSMHRLARILPITVVGPDAPPYMCCVMPDTSV